MYGIKWYNIPYLGNFFVIPVTEQKIMNKLQEKGNQKVVIRTRV